MEVIITKLNSINEVIEEGREKQATWWQCPCHHVQDFELAATMCKILSWQQLCARF